MSKRNMLGPITELTIVSRHPDTYRVVHQGRIVGRVKKSRGHGTWSYLTQDDPFYTTPDSAIWNGGYATKADSLDALLEVTR